MDILSIPPLLAHCSFNKTPTGPILLFEAAVLVGTLACFWLLPRLQTKIQPRFWTMAIGVLLFELFTAPMWHNYRMGHWAYIYQDVSWILTLGWTSLMLTIVLVTDKLLGHWREWKRFIVYLGAMTLAVLPLEALVRGLGIRSYAPEVEAILSGPRLAGVPIEFLYYVPVFTGLVIGFYKYWGFVIDDALLIPVKRVRWLRGLGITALAIILLELMVEPMVENRGWPQWSYIIHDISLLMTGIWIVIIAITALLVYRFFAHFSIVARFAIAVVICSAIALPIEYSLYSAGLRVYGASAMENFSGFGIPSLNNAPVEIAFAIFGYMTLVIAFIRYWEISLDNRL